MKRCCARDADCTSAMLSIFAMGSSGSTAATDCRIASGSPATGPIDRTTHDGENQVCTIRIIAPLVWVAGR